MIYSFLRQEGDHIGSDGCGQIEEIGDGANPEYRSKKVAFLSDAYANFVVKKEN